MKSNEERLRFAARFASLDLGALRSGDLMNLREDIAKFLFRTLFSMGKDLHPRNPEPSKLSIDDLRALQQKTQRVLQIVSGSWQWDGAPPVTEVKLRYSFFRPRPDRTYISLWGDTRDLFLSVLHETLMGDQATRIGRCSACERFFYRENRKQQYCSTRCRNRQYMATYRRHPEIRARESERNHKAYVSRLMKASPGAKPKRLEKRE